MIYVVVKESGEYSDYSMELVFASADEDVAKLKLQELEKKEMPLKEAYDEWCKLSIERDQTHPCPGPRRGYKNDYAEYHKAHYEWMNATNEMLIKKYNINTLDYPPGLTIFSYEENRYDIIEVESD